MTNEPDLTELAGERIKYCHSPHKGDLHAHGEQLARGVSICGACACQVMRKAIAESVLAIADFVENYRLHPDSKTPEKGLAEAIRETFSVK